MGYRTEPLSSNIAQNIDRIYNNISKCYDIAEKKGATIYSPQNSNNLPATIASIPQGEPARQLGTFAQGDIVRVPFVNDTLRDHIVLRHGAPNATMYHGWGDSVFLIQRHAFSPRISRMQSVYSGSGQDLYLRNEYPAIIAPHIWEMVVEGRIPHATGNSAGTIQQGINGLLVKAFVLSHTEIGLPSTAAVFGIGADFGLFTSDASRIWRTSMDVGEIQHTRAVNTNVTLAPGIQAGGTFGPGHTLAQLMGVRPVIVLPSATLVGDNNVLIGG